GGTAGITADGAPITISSSQLFISANARAGDDNGNGNGGNAVAGTVRLTASNAGSFAFSGFDSSAGSGTYSASAVGGNANVSGVGGNATGGNILITNLAGGGALGLDQNDFGIRIDTRSTSG